ncbi:hypothetical protein HDV00_003754 [Rhizophlyctis rosea]|nr:hypothetical protein HDV00_003754 [Rhizophlyctis rosea]
MLRDPSVNQQIMLANNTRGSVATVPVTSLDESQQSSGNSVLQSYLMLNDQAQPDNDPEDPFNKFWEVVENLVQKISVTGPVAFTTAPLGNEPPQLQVNTVLSPSSQTSGRPADHMENDPLRSTTMLNSYFVIPPHNSAGSPISSPLPSMGQSSLQPAQYNADLVNTTASVDSNFFGGAGRRATVGIETMQPLGVTAAQRGQSGIRPRKTLEEYQIENEQLKQTIDMLTRKVALLERAAEENNLLRSSIIQFRQDFQKQAKRLMHNQSASGIRTGPVPHPSQYKPHMSAADMSSTSAAQRIAELEDELNRVREESEKQNVAMQRYKERWDKLKESAKRKKEAKASGASPVPDSMNELPSPLNTPETRAALPPRPPPAMDSVVPRFNPSEPPSFSSSPSSHFSESPPLAHGPPGFRDTHRQGLAAGLPGGQQHGVNVVRRISGPTSGRREETPGAGARSVQSLADASLFYSTTSGAGMGFE